MGVIDDIYSMLNTQRQEQEDVFKRFGVRMTDKNYLILPEKFRKEVGEMYHRIRFSDTVNEPAEGMKNE